MLASGNHNPSAKPEARRKALFLRDSHHTLARLQAAGLRNKDLVERSGYSSQRIWSLNQDPAYLDLVARYRTEVDESWIRSLDAYHSLAFQAMIKAERMLNDDLDEHEEDGTRPSLKTLDAISQGRADRFGYGRHSTQFSVNVGLAASLDRAIKRSGKTIDQPSASLGVEMAPGPAVTRTEVAPVPIRRIAGPPLLLDDEPEMTNSARTVQYEEVGRGPPVGNQHLHAGGQLASAEPPRIRRRV